MIYLFEIGNLIVRNFGSILTFGSVFIAFMALIITSRSFSEHNRPYVSLNFEADTSRCFLYIIIRNTGIRGAENVSITIDPPPRSYFFRTNPGDRIFSNFSFPFLAPQQVIKASFDYCKSRYSNDQDPDNDIFEVKISYQYKKKLYPNSYMIDISYLKHLFGETASDIENGFNVIHKDMQRIEKALAPLKKMI